MMSGKRPTTRASSLTTELWSCRQRKRWNIIVCYRSFAACMPAAGLVAALSSSSVEGWTIAILLCSIRRYGTSASSYSMPLQNRAPIMRCRHHGRRIVFPGPFDRCLILIFTQTLPLFVQHYGGHFSVICIVLIVSRFAATIGIVVVLASMR